MRGHGAKSFYSAVEKALLIRVIFLFWAGTTPFYFSCHSYVFFSGFYFQPHFLGGLSLHLNHLYSIAHDNLRLAIWDTSFWTFWVEFGHKGPLDVS